MIKETIIARKAAKKAGKLLKDIYGSALEINIKKDGSLVTNADYESEAIIMDILQEKSDYAIFSEESGANGNEKHGMWIVDPLDGTYSFSRNMPLFAVSIAFAINNEIKSGVVYVPMLDEMFYAEHGKGAYLNDRPISVSKNKRIRNACINITGSLMRNRMDAIKNILAKAPKIRVLGSAACEFAYVACSRFDVSIATNIKPYDIAAATLIVREAGGIVSDFNGSLDVLKRNDVFASNAHLHKRFIELLSTKKV